MIDSFTAKAQLAVTVMWLIGVFGLFYMEGLGYFAKGVPQEGLLAATGVILYFWFNRQRNQEDPKADKKEEAV